MAQVSPVQFARQTYQTRSGSASIERLVNMYLEQNPQGAKGPVTLYGTPGLVSFATPGSGPIRGMQFMNPLLYVVSGSELYTVSTSGTTNLVGEIGDTGQVFMTENGSHVAILTRGRAYAVNATSIIELPESGLNGAAYQDGYGIFTQQGTQQFWITGLDDMTTIGGTDFSSADTLSDTMVGCISDHRELWLFKERSIEVWYNSGAAAFPFTRASSGIIERGCLSGGSIAKDDNSVFWLGDDGAVYQAAGYTPRRISTPAIELLIGNTMDASTTSSWTYRQEGHVFYVLAFSDLTLVYDITTGLWHERRSDGLDRWRVNSYAFAFDKHLVGDYETGEIYELDLDTFTEDGETIHREATAPTLHANGTRAYMYEFYVDMDNGVGLNDGQGSDPTLLLDWSEDGGETYENVVEASAGKIGKYHHRATWTRLGGFRQRSVRLRITDPVKIAIVGAYARVEGGSA